MRRGVVFAAALIVAWGSTGHGQQRPSPAAASPADFSARAVVTRYCVTCHSDALKTGGVTLARLDVDHPSAGAETWERAIRKLRAGLMPPSGAPRPDRATLETLRHTIEASIDRDAVAHPNAGATSLHRLNRTEYANAIRDLLDLDVDATTLLPPDDSAEGFDNIADVLGTSPALIERYVGAAGKISRLAVGDTDIGPVSVTYKVRGDLSQDKHIDGLPLGTRGGILIRHNFPADGEYLFKFSLLKVNFGPQYGGAAKDEQLEMTVNGGRVLLRDLRSVPYYYIRGGAASGPAAPLEIKLPMKAGPQTIVVTFIRKSAAYVDDLIQRFDATTADLQTGVQFGYTTVPHLSGVEILGPYDVTGPGNAPSRARIFVCRPPRPDADDESCARTIISTLARRAFRRPVTAADLSRLMVFYREGRGPQSETAETHPSFDRGIEMALRRILADPEFVFRFERDPVSRRRRAPRVGSRARLASLVLPLEQHSRRRAADRCRAGQAARTRRAAAAGAAHAAGPALPGARHQFRGPVALPAGAEEPQPRSPRVPRLRRQPAAGVPARDRTALRQHRARRPQHLRPADRRLHLRQRAAREALRHPEHLRQRLPPRDGHRPGAARPARARQHPDGDVGPEPHLARHARCLDSGQPARQPAALPPPNVPPFPEKKSGQGIVEEATIGAGSDGFSTGRISRAAAAIRSWTPSASPSRTSTASATGAPPSRGFQIDASGQLVDGTPIDGPASLRAALLNYPDAFAQTLTEKLLMYAVGRRAQYYDMPSVRAIARDAARQDYRFSALVLGIVNSQAFQMRGTGR